MLLGIKWIDGHRPVGICAQAAKGKLYGVGFATHMSSDQVHKVFASVLGGVESGTESGQMTKPVLEVRHADSICGSDTARDQHLILRMVQKDQLLEPLVNAGGLTLGE